MTPAEIEAAWDDVEEGAHNEHTGSRFTDRNVPKVKALRHEMAVMTEMIELMHRHTVNNYDASTPLSHWRKQAERELKGGK